MTGPLVALLLAGAAAGAAPAPPPPAVRGPYDPAARAREAARLGHWRRAASFWRLVLARDPGDVEAVLGLGRALEALGEHAEAEATYARLPMEADAVLARARLLESEHPEHAARLYQRLHTLRLEDPGSWWMEARAWLAAGDLAAARAAADRYLELLSPGEPLPGAAADLLVELGAALRAAGESEAAAAAWSTAAERCAGCPAAEEAAARLQRLELEREAARLRLGGGEPLDPATRGRLATARAALAAGDTPTAADLLEGLVRDAPRSAEVRGALGELERARGDLASAERAWTLATLLDPEDPRWHARLGALLADAYGGRRHGEAIEAISAALALRPGWTDLHLLRCRLLQEAARFEEAVRACTAYLEAAPADAPGREEARARLAALRRPRPEPPDLAALGRPAGFPEEAWRHYSLARLLQQRGASTEALAELEEAARLAPERWEPWNLRAAIELALGRREGAVEAWRRSLDRAPGQPAVRLSLGELLRDTGQVEAARRELRAAARAGAPEALVDLAEIALREGETGEARRELARYFATAAGGRYHERARELQAGLDRRRRARLLALAGAVAALAAVPLGRWWWRRATVPLEDLLARSPEAARAAVPVLSALRHDVVKHNLTVLSEVADALEAGERERAAAHAPAAERAVERWRSARERLRELAASHGMRLDVRRPGSVLSAFDRSMAELARLLPRLRRGRRSAAPALRRVEGVLVGRCWQELGDLVAAVGVTRVDGALLLACWERVAREPALRHARLAEAPLLELPDGPLALRIPRSELESVVENLVRNALAAMAEALPRGERRMGLAVREERDPITGLGEGAIEVRDTAPTPLDAEAFRAAPEGRGLWLVAHAVERNRGRVEVRPAPGWAKSVTVLLELAEQRPGAAS